MATTYEILWKAERMELVAARIYQLLAQRFTTMPWAKDAFARMSDEEVEHASRIHTLAVQYRKDSGLFRGGQPGAEQDFDLLLADAEAFHDQLVSGQGPAALQDALTWSGQLEARLAEVHAEHLTAGCDPLVQAFFVKLAEQDRQHRALLAMMKT